MKLEVASQRIASFGERFGQSHLYLAYHAAFPLALTPDLLYQLWANFQRDIHNEVLNIPWMAVADLLLSSLCDEVGHELYEMEISVRNALLDELNTNSRFGAVRITQLSNFLLIYVHQQIESHDLDMRDFAQAQKWTALAYTQPSEAVDELTSVLSELEQSDIAEWTRMAALLETFPVPLTEFELLLTYARGMEKFARGDHQGAIKYFIELREKDYSTKTLIKLPIPKEIALQSEANSNTGSSNLYTLSSSKKPLILVIDDNPANLSLLQATLQGNGYEIQIEDSGKTSLNLIEQLLPDLILLDVSMPEIDGYQVIQHIRQNKSLPYIPIILLSSEYDTASAVRGLDTGADDFIRKPIDLDELLARVRSLLRLKLNLDEKDIQGKLTNSNIDSGFSPSEKEKQQSLKSFSNNDEDIAKLIAQGENELVEFKASAFCNIQKQKRDRTLEKSIARTIASFLNTEGGTLLIGVTDNGSIIGIEEDYKSLDIDRNRELYESFLREIIIKNKLGNFANSLAQIIFHKIEGKDLCQISIKSSPDPVYIDGKFFVRVGVSTRELTAKKLIDHNTQTYQNNFDLGEMDFHSLEQFLIARDWKAADHETEKLIFQVAGQTQSDFLGVESIRNLPCNFLENIDQLWVRHTDGRFGFSVQQRIWEELGLATGSKNYEGWWAFGDIVGWRRGDKWVPYRTLKFSLDAPAGHLPFFRAWIGMRKTGLVHSVHQSNRFYVLMYRCAYCSLASKNLKAR